jgi:uncharacterized protein YwqG
MRDIEKLVRGFARSTVRVKLTDRPTRSHFGGPAELPRGMTIPPRVCPLALLARISLTELQAAAPTEWLPKSGALLVFADIERWFDILPKDPSAYLVLHVEDLAQPVDARTKKKHARPRARNIAFERTETLPSRERSRIQALALTDDEESAYHDLRHALLGGLTRHQVDGFPNDIQHDEEEFGCQLAHTGIDARDFVGDNDSRDAAVEAAQRDWRLLFQFDSDDDLDVMWGDAGTLYFFVREEDARRGDFSGVRASWQCY